MINDPIDFKYPKSFTLLGHRYNVVFDPEWITKEDAFGEASDDTKRITIQPAGTWKSNASGSIDVTHAMVTETYYHELMHIIFDAIGEDKLAGNERLVNMLGKALLEIYLTSNYDEKK